MRSVITSAVLATAVFGQALGAKAGHRHQHLHERRAKEAAEKRADMVTATIDGKVETWVNDYFGAAATVASVVESAVDSVASVASSVVADVTSAAVATTNAASSTKSSSAAAATSSSDSSDGVISDTATTITSALEDFAETLLGDLKVLKGANAELTAEAAVGFGTNGTFQFDITNSADEDIVLVVWSSYNDAVTWDAMTVQVTNPNITLPIASGSSVSIGFNPQNHNQGQISGAMSAIYSDTVLSTAGSVKNTWVEFSFSTDNVYSTVDVSRLVDPSGHTVSVQNYKSSLSNGEYVQGDATCLTDMTTCVFVCTDDAADCTYTLSNCEVGAAGNTADASGQDGGCDYEGASGISKIVFS